MSEPVIIPPETQDVPDERTFFRKVVQVAANLPFASQLVTAWYCAIDPETPPYVRRVLLGALAYFVLPMDAIPDFIALIGFTDDLAVLAAAFAAVSSNITDAHREKAEKKLAELRGSPAVPDDADMRTVGGEEGRESARPSA